VRLVAWLTNNLTNNLRNRNEKHGISIRIYPEVEAFFVIGPMLQDEAKCKYEEKAHV
jgi:hypothetical protein